MINLAKLNDNSQGEMVKTSMLNLDKSLAKLNLSKTQARVGVCLDYSGSMRGMYQDTIVIGHKNNSKKGLLGKLFSDDEIKISYIQKLLLRLMPLALRFDDNGELDCWSFTDSFLSLEPMTLDNFANYVNEEVKTQGKFGGTSYQPVLTDVVNYYDDNNEIPAFVLFLTDGECADSHRKLDEYMRSISQKNIFIQFIGLGNSSFKYLEHLDDLQGRLVDNTGFLKVSDFDSLNDNELYELLLKEFKNWLAGNQ